MSNKLINFGVIGTGHIGKRHAEMIVRNNESNLVSLCDVKPKAELGLENYKANFYQTHIEMLQTHPRLNQYTPNYAFKPKPILQKTKPHPPLK